MKYKPKKNNKKVYAACVIYLLVICAAFVFEAFNMGHTFLNQLTVLVFATAAIYTLRYVIFDFVYSVDEEGYFEVIRIGSKIPKTFASVKMSKDDIVVKEEKNMERYSVTKKERFNVTMFAPRESMYWYIFTLNGEKQALILECDENFAGFLKSYIKNIDNQNSK